MSEDHELDGVIRRTVTVTLEALGIDTSDPAATRADFVHLRRMRVLVEKGTTWTLFALIGLGVAGMWTAVSAHIWH